MKKNTKISKGSMISKSGGQGLAGNAHFLIEFDGEVLPAVQELTIENTLSLQKLVIKKVVYQDGDKIDIFLENLINDKGTIHNIVVKSNYYELEIKALLTKYEFPIAAKDYIVSHMAEFRIIDLIRIIRKDTMTGKPI